MDGGCLCGAIRYRLAANPSEAGWCHCRTCQLNSGSPAMAFATIAAADYQFTQGQDQTATFASSETGERHFCKRCGTPLFFRDKAAPETLDFSLATLDDASAIRPGFHIYYASRQPWAEAADALPRYPRSRREGL